jgi:hypothetical protein
MEAWKRFLFEHDRLNSFPDQEHCCRCTTRSAADYKHIGFGVNQPCARRRAIFRGSNSTSDPDRPGSRMSRKNSPAVGTFYAVRRSPFW